MCAEEHAVGPTVIVAFELDDFVATSVSASQPEGGGYSLGTGRAETNQVDMGNTLDDEAGDISLEIVREGELNPATRDRVDDGIRDLSWPVAEDQRAIAEGVVDVA